MNFEKEIDVIKSDHELIASTADLSQTRKPEMIKQYKTSFTPIKLTIGREIEASPLNEASSVAFKTQARTAKMQQDSNTK